MIDISMACRSDDAIPIDGEYTTGITITNELPTAWLKQRVDFFRWKLAENRREKQETLIEYEVCEIDTFNVVHDNSCNDWKKRFDIFCGILRTPPKKIRPEYIKDRGYALVIKLVDANEEELARALEIEIEEYNRTKQQKEENPPIAWWWTLVNH